MSQTNCSLGVSVVDTSNDKFKNHSNITSLNSITIRDMHSAVGGKLEDFRTKIDTAKLGHPTDQNGLQPEDGAAPNACSHSNVEQLKIPLTKAGSKNRTNITQYKQISADHQQAFDDFADNHTRLDILEMMRQSEADKVKVSKIEIASLRRQSQYALGEKELEISQLKRENKRLERENYAIGSELDELKLQNKTQQLVDGERLQAQNERINELEQQLRDVKSMFDIKELEFRSLRKEHQIVNNMMVIQEKLISDLQGKVKFGM